MILLKEPKPSWNEVPAAVKTSTERLFGSEIVGAEIVWGGYSPSATFKITFKNGKNVFCKGVHPRQTQFGKDAFLSEKAVYESGVVAEFHPRYYGCVEGEDWNLLFLEDLSHGSLELPWSRVNAFAVIEKLAHFHQRFFQKEMPQWIPVVSESPIFYKTFRERFWFELSSDTKALKSFVSYMEESGVDSRWLREVLPQFVDLETKIIDLGGPKTLLHFDLRSDNILFVDSEPVFLDWPFLSYGSPAYDLVFFASCFGEGGPHPDEMLAHYEARSGFKVNPADIQILIAFFTGFFADRVQEPPPPELPRLRGVQKLQLVALLEWAKSRF
jgi:fructosamine-3-kinase